MNWFEWFLIIFGSTFILSIIILGLIIIYKLKRKKSVHATIFLSSGGQTKFLIDRKKTDKISFNNKSYSFDEKAVRKTAWRDFIYYRENKTNPLYFEDDKDTKSMNPEELKIILENDLVSKLFGNKELQTIQLLIIICLITGIISFFLLLYIVMSGVELKDNEANREFLMNVTRSVLRGG